MNQILNLLLFLRELVFGRDATSRMTRAQRIKSTIGFAILFISIIANYYLFKSLYETTARSLELKQEIAALHGRVIKDRDLALEVQLLEKILHTLTGEVISGQELVSEIPPVQTIVAPAPPPGAPVPLPDAPPSVPKVIIIQPSTGRDESLSPNPKIE